MTPEALTGEAAKECLQMVVWVMAEEDGEPEDILMDITSILVDYGIDEDLNVDLSDIDLED